MADGLKSGSCSSGSCSPRLERRLRAGLVPALLLVGALALTGCAQVTSSVLSMPPADDTVCHDPSRKQFYDAAQRAVNDEQSRQLLDTVTGLARTVTPFLQFLPGVGGALGSTAGSLSSSMIDQALTMITALNDAARRDTTLITDVDNTYNALVRCRQTEVRRIRGDYRARRLNRADAESKLNQLRGWAQQDAAAAREVNRVMLARSQQINGELDKVDPNLGSQPGGGARRQSPPQVVAARQTVLSNQRALAQQSTRVDRSVADSEFQVSALEPGVVPAGGPPHALG